MSKRLLLAALFAVVIGSSAAWAQEGPMRPLCDPEQPLTPGACFDDVVNVALGSFLLVDDDGDAFQGWIQADWNNFAVVAPNGRTQLHFQDQSEFDLSCFPNCGLLACRAGDFPACAVPPFPGLLVGSGNMLIAGEIIQPGIIVQTPFLFHATGLLADINTGQEFRVTVSWVLSGANELVVNDIKIRVAN